MRWPKWPKIAKGYGVRIALENIFALSDAEYRQTPEKVGETVKAVNSPNVCGLIDFSHAYIECTRLGLDWREQIQAMAPVTGHLHVHDSFGRPYSMTKFYHPAEATALGIGDLHLPIGWGDIPWEEIFSELTIPAGYDADHGNHRRAVCQRAGGQSCPRAEACGSGQ